MSENIVTLKSGSEVTEHIVYGNTNLYVHLSLLFNSLIRHCFVPSDFCVGLIVPVLKNKHGDASSLNIYIPTGA